MFRSGRLLHLLGETTREIGILMLVFAPLDSAFAEREIKSGFLVTVIVVSVILIACRILLEARE